MYAKSINGNPNRDPTVSISTPSLPVLCQILAACLFDRRFFFSSLDPARCPWKKSRILTVYHGRSPPSPAALEYLNGFASLVSIRPFSALPALQLLGSEKLLSFPHLLHAPFIVLPWSSGFPFRFHLHTNSTFAPKYKSYESRIKRPTRALFLFLVAFLSSIRLPTFELCIFFSLV